PLRQRQARRIGGGRGVDRHQLRTPCAAGPVADRGGATASRTGDGMNLHDTAVRSRLIDWYRRNRQRSRELFNLVAEDAYYTRPIALRHPVVFYEGHLPAFTFNTLAKKALGQPGIDARLETLFARGI